MRVVWRCCSFHQDMSFNGEPTEFKQIRSHLFVAKHPEIVSFQIESAPVALASPIFVFLRVGAPGISIFPRLAQRDVTGSQPV